VLVEAGACNRVPRVGKICCASMPSVPARPLLEYHAVHALPDFASYATPA
jgi:hypothetical protein